MEVNMRMIVSSEAKEQQERSPLSQNTIDGMGAAEEWQAVTDAQENSIDSLKNNTALMKEFGDIMPEIIKNLRYMNNAVSQTATNLPNVKKTITSQEKLNEQLAKNMEGGALSLVNTGGNMFQNFANGNIGGMATSFLSGTNRLIDYGKDSAKAADNKDMLGMLGALGIGAFVAQKIAEGINTISQKYIDEMPTIYGSGRAFGMLNDVDAKMSYDKINAYNTGTNLNTQGFSELVQSLRQQGLGNGLGYDEQVALAGSVAQTVGRWAYATGGDANQYASLAGIMSRYGGSTDVAGDFNRLVSAGYASGLSDTQIPEFLSGIQKVMEDGIAKGFSRSATDVASTMLMFSKMSGNNAFWQGEQGAKLLNQANQGLSSATSLSKTSDILAYRAFAKAYEGREKDELKDLYLENGDYVNTMMLMERGLDADNFGSIMGAINDTTGSTEGRIERLRQMFGVNYTGASRLLQLDPTKLNKQELQAEIDKIKNAPDMQNNETKYQEAMNQIKQYVVGMGQGIAELKIQGMDMVVTGIDKITNFLGLGNNDAIFSDEPLTAYHPVTGESLEGAWTLKDTINKKSEFKSLLQRKGDKGFGDLTFKLAGLDNNNFIDFLWENKDKENGNFRKIVEEASSDTILTEKEQSDIEQAINRLYDLWKTELKNVTLQESS